MPAQQYARVYIATSGHRHPLVEVLHQCVLRIWRERLDDIGDIGRFGAVEDHA